MDHINALTLTVGGFLIVNLLIGLWAGRGVKTIEDYAVGSRKWGTGALVMTYMATIIGAGSLFRESFETYKHGILITISFLGLLI
jgi:SSS family solute:Na+ symporter